MCSWTADKESPDSNKIQFVTTCFDIKQIPLCSLYSHSALGLQIKLVNQKFFWLSN